jgi:hypothetical protein
VEGSDGFMGSQTRRSRMSFPGRINSKGKSPRARKMPSVLIYLEEIVVKYLINIHKCLCNGLHPFVA